MTARKNRERVKKGPAGTQEAASSGPSERTEKESATNYGDEYLTAWVNFAKGLGETTTDFVRRFGDEQQKNYERWAAVSTDTAKPRPTSEDIKDVAARFTEWKNIADEIGQKFAEALTTGLPVQKDLFSAWSRTASTETPTPEQQAREFSSLVQKFWTGVLTSAFEKYGESLAPDLRFEDFVKGQEESLKDFSERFRKFSYAYLTSPPFVSAFGRTLDQTLEMQKAFAENGGLANYFGAIPTKKDFDEINNTLKEIVAKVDRLEEKIS